MGQFCEAEATDRATHAVVCAVSVGTLHVVGLVLLLASSASCKHHRDGIPRAHGTIRIDGDWEEPDWVERARRAQFRGDDGQLARPSSEIRWLRDDHDLLVALYAADQNIETRDAFDLSIGSLALHLAATGTVTPAVPGVRAAAGYDEGTLDNPSDDDEEWVVEVAIPLPLVHGDVHVSRCDVPKDGVRRCGSWSGALE